MLISRAFCIARRSRKFPSGFPPPSRAAIVISRLARVNACPRLASTMAFLCLMPAHFEWPDTYARTPEVLWKKIPGVPAKSKISWGGNMLSLILLHHKPRPPALADLHHDVTRLQRIIASRNLAVDLDSSLLDEPLCFRVGGGQ